MRGGQSGEAGGGLVGQRTQFEHFGEQVCGGVVGQRRDRGDDLGFAGEDRVLGDERLDLGVDGFQMALDEVQLGVMLSFEQGIGDMRGSVEQCGSLPDQGVFGGLQSCRRRWRREAGGAGRSLSTAASGQHAGVDERSWRALRWPGRSAGPGRD